MKKIIFLLFYSFTFIGFCFAQEQLVLGKTYKVQSKILKEDRKLNIYTPDGYHPDSSKTYPVIYLLDGSANEDFVHIVGIVQFLTMIDAMPKSIVIGITNVDRKRDFTFPTTIKKDKEDFPTTGGSANFINFLAKEVQPFVEQKFKTNTSKTIIGQSLGGLLATEILLKQSKLFDNYVMISPSLWWDKQSLLKDVETVINNKKLISTKVYIAVGEEGKVMKEDATKLAEVLQKNKDLKVSFEFFGKEDHATILHNSVYQILLKMYTKGK